MPDTPLRNDARASLAELEHHDAFSRRHIGPDAGEQAQMLAALGFRSRAELIYAVIPPNIRRREPMDLGAPRTEGEALTHLRHIAEKSEGVVQ